MSAVQERERIRILVDMLPEDDLHVAERVLRGLIGDADPVLRALLDADQDDEPTPDEEEAAVQEALADLEANRTSSTSEMMGRLGALTQSSVWQVEWTRAAESDLARLDPPIARRVVQAVLRFAATGQGDVRALSGQLGGYRLRVGSWRVRFVSDRSIRTICVLRVLHRREAYDHP